jgi:hypothetical protein
LNRNGIHKYQYKLILNFENIDNLDHLYKSFHKISELLEWKLRIFKQKRLLYSAITALR